MSLIPGLAVVVAGLAVIASAAGAWAQQTEQPSLSTSPSPRPLPRSQRPTKRIMQNTAAVAWRTTVLTCYNVIYLINKHCLL
jgi:hypothetical protein